MKKSDKQEPAAPLWNKYNVLDGEIEAYAKVTDVNIDTEGNYDDARNDIIKQLNAGNITLEKLYDLCEAGESWSPPVITFIKAANGFPLVHNVLKIGDVGRDCISETLIRYLRQFKVYEDPNGNEHVYRALEAEDHITNDLKTRAVYGEDLVTEMQTLRAALEEQDCSYLRIVTS